MYASFVISEVEGAYIINLTLVRLSVWESVALTYNNYYILVIHVHYSKREHQLFFYILVTLPTPFSETSRNSLVVVYNTIQCFNNNNKKHAVTIKCETRGQRTQNEQQLQTNIIIKK